MPLNDAPQEDSLRNRVELGENLANGGAPILLTEHREKLEKLALFPKVRFQACFFTVCTPENPVGYRIQSKRRPLRKL